MKKLYILSALLLFTTFSFAQTFNWGIKGGVNLSTVSGVNTPVPFNNKLAGFNAGAIVDIGFSDFSIQPGIFYSIKGNKAVYSALLETANQQVLGASTFTISNKLGYLELPVNFLYNIIHLPGGNIHLGAGPYLGYGISETLTAQGQTSHPTFSDNYKNPDYGVNLIAGTKLFNHFLVDAQYGFGVANINPNGGTSHNRVLSFSAGYLFR